MKLKIENQRIEIVETELFVSNTVNVYRVTFEFDESWDGYQPVAVFECRDGRHTEAREVVIVDNSAIIPWETLLPGGMLRIGVYGTRDGQRLPTVYTPGQYVSRGAESAEEGTEATPGALEQVLNIIGVLSDLETEDKTTLVNAINEAAESGGGLTSTAANYLVTILRNAVYITDQSANINALENELGGSGDGGTDKPDTPDIPDTPVETTYTVTTELTNVISSNGATTVSEGASYETTLTAVDGYELDRVTAMMGGVDVTADVYADGAIDIATVTGDVVIIATATANDTGVAELPVDGLIAFFDLRNIADELGDNITGFYVPATQGTGRLYSWAKEFEMSAKLTFCIGETFDPYEFGSEFTWILKTHSDDEATIWGIIKYISPSNFGAILKATYTTLESTATTGDVNLGKYKGYQTTVLVVSGEKLFVYNDGIMQAEFDGVALEGFVSWYDVFESGLTWVSSGGGSEKTAIALYGRALSNVEIVEACEYLKTLEVQ